MAGAFNQPVVSYSNSTKNFIQGNIKIYKLFIYINIIDLTELIRQSGVNSAYQRDVERTLHHTAPLSHGKKLENTGASSKNSSPVYFGKLNSKWQAKRTQKQIQEKIQATPDDVFVPRLPSKLSSSVS